MVISILTAISISLILTSFFYGYGKSDCPPGIPEDLDLGFLFNEHNGGGGLVAETVRIINGNVLEKRADINFASPNSRGLSFVGCLQ